MSFVSEAPTILSRCSPVYVTCNKDCNHVDVEYTEDMDKPDKKILQQYVYYLLGIVITTVEHSKLLFKKIMDLEDKIKLELSLINPNVSDSYFNKKSLDNLISIFNKNTEKLMIFFDIEEYQLPFTKTYYNEVIVLREKKQNLYILVTHLIQFENSY